MYGDATQPVKVFYNGTMYRYERPQSGRMRELTQFGCEVLGCDDPYIDAEIISIPVQLFRLLGLKEVKVNINTLGDQESRDNYRNALIEYFKPHIDTLCEDCQSRFNKNPLRILDCKVDGDKDLLKNAPKITDYLNDSSRIRYSKVKEYLDLMEIPYNENPNIVRGLDYYNHTVFEIEASVEGFGAQNVLAGGGRYNTLVENLDGPHTPAIGFACGLDRLLLALESEDIELNIHNQLDAYIMYVSDTEKEYAITLCQTLRLSGFCVELETMNRSLKSQFKQADRLNSKFLIILNDEDINLATLIGLIHDVGRFEQIKRFNTLSDIGTMDHADFGAYLLFNEGLITKFTKDISVYPIIKESVAGHNKYSLKELDDERELTHLKLIRDADKIDIFNIWANLDELEISSSGDISKEVMKEFFGEKQIHNEYKKTEADKVVGTLSYLYDINFIPSYTYILDNNMIWNLYERLDNNDKEKFIEYFVYMDEYIREKVSNKGEDEYVRKKIQSFRSRKR